MLYIGIDLGTSAVKLLPKDYINYMLTGVHATDYSDASGMLLLDVKHKRWSREMLDICGVSAEQMPKLFESYEVIGVLRPEVAGKLGNNHVYFLPYLMGERSPINDTDARGTFVGMTMDTSRADMIQAVLEGVAFGIRDCMEAARMQGIMVERSKICGGGAMLAMAACGEYRDVQETCEKLVRTVDVVEPEPELAARYEERYQKYRKIYPALRNIFPEIM